MTDRHPTPSPETNRLSGIRRIAHDDEERPSREDRAYGQTIFTRAPVPMPRFLKRRSKRTTARP